MDVTTALRAIIRLVAEDAEGYKDIVEANLEPVNVRYYIDKNKSIRAKLDMTTGKLIMEDGQEMQWAKKCAV